MTVPELDPDILIARFRRKGGDSELTRLVENLRSDDRELLFSEAALDSGERPLLAYMGGSEDWLLVTSRMIRHAGADGRRSMRIVDLASVRHELKREGSRHGADKNQWRKLTIEARDGGCIVASVEPGAPFFTLWNTLRWAERWGALQRDKFASGGLSGRTR